MTAADTVANPKNYSREVIRRFVPATIAERAIALTVSTDASTYAPSDPVEITVAIRNRLPVPIEVATTDRRVWSWAVDGFEEATDERRYVEPVSNTIRFRPLETKCFTERWNGKIQRTGDLDRWTPLSREEHQITAWIHTAVTDRVVEDEARIRVE